jgi:hypothetical protein
MAALIFVGGIVLVIVGVMAWRRSPVVYLRIHSTPPGEAPEEIRRAWVGTELPLPAVEAEPGPLQTVGVLNQEDPIVMTGYAVDGRAAVAALARRSPEAAAWWRQNAPHVVASGYRLFFPSRVVDLQRKPASRARYWRAAGIIASAPLVVVVGLWLVFGMPPLWSQKWRAEYPIRSRGGLVTIDKDAAGGPAITIAFRERPIKNEDLVVLRPHLEALAELRELYLYRVEITDQGLLDLHGLTQLKTLVLGGPSYQTRCTAGAVAELRKALPNTKIDSYHKGYDTEKRLDDLKRRFPERFAPADK